MKLAMCDTHLYIFESRRERVWWYSKSRANWKLVRFDMVLNIYFN